MPAPTERETAQVFSFGMTGHVCLLGCLSLRAASSRSRAATQFPNTQGDCEAGDSDHRQPNLKPYKGGLLQKRKRQAHACQKAKRAEGGNRQECHDLRLCERAAPEVIAIRAWMISSLRRLRRRSRTAPPVRVSPCSWAFQLRSRSSSISAMDLSRADLSDAPTCPLSTRARMALRALIHCKKPIVDTVIGGTPRGGNFPVCAIDQGTAFLYH